MLLGCALLLLIFWQFIEAIADVGGHAGIEEAGVQVDYFATDIAVLAPIELNPAVVEAAAVMAFQPRQDLQQGALSRTVAAGQAFKLGQNSLH